MLAWLRENMGTIVISLGLIAVVVLIIRSLVRTKKLGKGTCSCGCSHCAMKGKCHCK